MAEKSIRIADGTSGLYVAVSDALQVDTSSHARIIQLLDFASRPFSSPIGFPARGNSRTRTYTSGGTHQVIVGDILTGAASGAAARVMAITLTGGSWAGGDAAGTITICDQLGTFQSEDLNEGVNGDRTGHTLGGGFPASRAVCTPFLPGRVLQHF